MELYAENILDHFRSPHHAGTLKKPTLRAVERNPLCGDVIQLDLQLSSKDIIKNIAFTGHGCAISQAGMSLLTDELVGSPVTSISQYTQEKIVGMLGIPISPARMKCAFLGLSAAKNALKKFQGKLHGEKRQRSYTSTLRRKSGTRTA